MAGGVDFEDKEPYVKIVFPNSVAEQQGLSENDLILAINGKPTAGMTHKEVEYCVIMSPLQITLDVQRTLDVQKVQQAQYWQPAVTGWAELTSGEREELPEGFNQKTSLAATNKRQEPSHIGCSHNRAPKPFYNATQENRGAPANQEPSHIGCSHNTSANPFYKAAEKSESTAQENGAIANVPDPLETASANSIPKPFVSCVSINMSASAAQENPCTSYVKPPMPNQSTSHTGIPVQSSSATRRVLQEVSAPVNNQYNSPQGLYSDANRAAMNEQASQLSKTLSRLIVSSNKPAKPTAAPTRPKVAPGQNFYKQFNTSDSGEKEEKKAVNSVPSVAFASGIKEDSPVHHLAQVLNGSQPTQRPSDFRPVQAPKTVYGKNNYMSAKLEVADDCWACEKAIVGGQLLVRVNGNVMHDFCYKCTSCGVLLKQRGHHTFNGGKLYCSLKCPEPAAV